MVKDPGRCSLFLQSWSRRDLDTTLVSTQIPLPTAVKVGRILGGDGGPLPALCRGQA